MTAFSQKFQVIWANLDPNAHVRHTAYNDYAAQVRVGFFEKFGLSHGQMTTSHLGMILFHEDTTFKNEVLMNDKITVDCAALGFRKDFKVWKLRHQIWKENGDLACTVIATGAFMDLTARKVVIPPKEVIEILKGVPKTDDFGCF